MNLQLIEWNKSCEYAKEVCKTLKTKGYDVRMNPYSMHDNRKGISFQVFDSMNNFFKAYYTGIHTNIDNMVTAIDNIVLRIIEEC